MHRSLMVLAPYFIVGTSLGQYKDTGTLRFFTGNFNNDAGRAMIQLYRSTDKVPDHPFMKVSGSLQNKSAIIDIHGLPYGDYAAILVHDENNNGQIDHAYGLPAEQLGYTNKWELGFFTGMPSFSKLKFHFGPTLTTQTVLITYKD